MAGGGQLWSGGKDVNLYGMGREDKDIDRHFGNGLKEVRDGYVREKSVPGSEEQGAQA